MEYPLKSYELTSLATLEQFWWDMYEICTNTPLGISANVNGQEITVEVSPGPTPETFIRALNVSVVLGLVRDLHQHAAWHLRQRQRSGDHCRGESRAHSEAISEPSTFRFWWDLYEICVNTQLDASMLEPTMKHFCC
jgi:hypothetical protein